MLVFILSMVRTYDETDRRKTSWYVEQNKNVGWFPSRCDGATISNSMVAVVKDRISPFEQSIIYIMDGEESEEVVSSHSFSCSQKKTIGTNAPNLTMIWPPQEVVVP
jgi:hypothetical protein